MIENQPRARVPDGQAAPAVKVSLFYMSAGDRAIVVAVSRRASAVARPEDVAVAVLEALRPRGPDLAAGGTRETPVVLPGIGELLVLLEVIESLPVLGVVHATERSAWHTGARYVERAKVLDTAWWLARPASRAAGGAS